MTIAAESRKPGRPAKPIADHIADGTFRKDRHGESPPVIDTKPSLKSLPSLAESKKWVRTAADEKAVGNGCRFSERLAAFVVDWFRKYLKLSEGSQWAGKPFELMDWQRDDVIYPIFGWVRKLDTGRIVRRIRKAYIHVAKKNGKSPLGAGIGTYMWAGDGEHGAKVFSAATDKNQAAIVHTHAVHMVEDSRALLLNAKINRTTHHIVFEPTRSVYQVVSGKASEYRGREGLNAHCIIADELHAWQGRLLYDALKYAFASRLEPLFFQITTAGDNVETVCFEQYEYAQGLLKGEITDERFHAAIYESARDADILDHAEWDKANPSLGHTIRLEDMVADAEEATKSARAVSTFKRYRMNVWCTAENPWLSAADWQECYERFTEDDLVGQPCWGGLDVAKVVDMTAFCLLFRDPKVSGLYRQLVWFFMPEQTYKDRQHLAPYEQWHADGWLELTPGGECDQDYIFGRVATLHERFKMRRLYYDEWQGIYIVQRLEAEHSVERVRFHQTIATYAAPTKEYERLIKTGNLRHNGNPVLAWQAGHVTTIDDRNQNIRPVKRKRGDHRTIDGIVVGIMALSGAATDMENATWEPFFLE